MSEEDVQAELEALRRDLAAERACGSLIEASKLWGSHFKGSAYIFH